jgi:hypothetical protein
MAENGNVFTLPMFKAWDIQIAADAELKIAGIRIAAALRFYLDWKDGTVRKPMKVMATALQVTPRTLARGFRQLEARGHIVGQKRPGLTPVWTLVLREPLTTVVEGDQARPLTTVVKGTPDTLLSGDPRQLAVNPHNMNHGKGRDKDGRERLTTRTKPTSKRSPNKKDPGTTTFPPDFTLTDHMVSEAQSISGWTFGRTELEFGKFRDYHRDQKESRFRSWPAAWRTWCRNGRTYDERDAQKTATIGAPSAILALDRWRKQ